MRFFTFLSLLSYAANAVFMSKKRDFIQKYKTENPDETRLFLSETIFGTKIGSAKYNKIGEEKNHFSLPGRMCHFLS